MLSERDIQQALRASRVIDLGVPAPYGPLGLEHLAEAVARLQAPENSASQRQALSIALLPATKAKLDQFASVQTKASSRVVTAGDVAAAIVEQIVASLPTP
jgi:hypothetical protein